MTKPGDLDAAPPSDRFPTETAGLAESVSPEVVQLADGDELNLRIAPVAKRLGDTSVRMLAYGGSIPGPTLRAAHSGRDGAFSVEGP
jgi:hypothetical protein